MLLETREERNAACFDNVPVSSQSGQIVGETYSLAHQLGKLTTKACPAPSDQVSPYNGDLFLDLEHAQDLKERIMENNAAQSSGATALDDSGVSVAGTSTSAKCKKCGCPAPLDESDAMDTSDAGQDNDAKYEWEQKRVTDEDLALMKRWQSNKLPTSEIENNAEVNTWFEYLPKQASDGSYKESRYRCFYCHKYSKDFLFHERYLSDFSKPEGIFHSLSFENKRAIMRHVKSKSHLHIINELKEKQEYSNTQEIAGLIKDKFEYLGTNKHLRLVYSEIKMYNSYRSHKQMVFLQKKHNVNMGNRCGNWHTAKKMTLSIR